MSRSITVRAIALLLLLVATAGGIKTYHQYSSDNWFGVAPPRGQSGSGPSINPIFAEGSMYDFAVGIIAKLPPGTTVVAKDFDAVLGVAAGDYLRTADVQKIEVKADLFEVTLGKAILTNLNGQADLRVAKLVKFNYFKDTAGTVHLNKLNGVDVRVSTLLGWMPVRQVDFSRATADDTLVVVTVDSFFGKMSRSFTIGPDGKPRGIRR